GRRCLERARRLLEEGKPQAKDDPGVMETLANVYVRIASSQCAASEWDEALATLKQARELLTRLTRANPAVLHYQDELATTLRQMGHAYRDNNKLVRALEHYGEAVKISERLSRVDPDLSIYRRGLAKGWFDTAICYFRDPHLGDAVVALEKARDVYRELAKV